MIHAKGKFQIFSLLDRQKIAFPHLKGKRAILEKIELALFKIVPKVAHFTDFFLRACSMYSHFDFELKKIIKLYLQYLTFIPETLKHWVDVQWGQSYHMGRGYLFSSG